MGRRHQLITLSQEDAVLTAVAAPQTIQEETELPIRRSLLSLRRIFSPDRALHQGFLSGRSGCCQYHQLRDRRHHRSGHLKRGVWPLHAWLHANHVRTRFADVTDRYTLYGVCPASEGNRTGTLRRQHFDTSAGTSSDDPTYRLCRLCIRVWSRSARAGASSLGPGRCVRSHSVARVRAAHMLCVFKAQDRFSFRYCRRHRANLRTACSRSL